jgi:hypothetical protein
MAGDPNAQDLWEYKIYENVCVQLQNLSVELPRSYATALLYLPMESSVNEGNTTAQHLSNKIL